jgi:hypothetical protein
MAWTPPSDSVEATVAPSTGGWKPPADAVTTSWTPPADAVTAEAAAPTPKLSLLETAKQSSAQAKINNLERAKKIEENELSFKDLYEKPDVFKSINDYAVARFGKEGAMLPNETKEDYVKRWSTAMRATSVNLMDTRDERLWLENAKQEDALKAKKAYDIWDRTASFYTEKGQGGFRPIVDILSYGVTDPTNVISLLTGNIANFAARQVAKEGIKTALKTKLAIAAPVVGVEAGSAAYSNIEDQQKNLLAQKAENKDGRAKLEEAKKVVELLPPDEKAKATEQVAEFEKELVENETKVAAGIDTGELAKATAIGTGFGLLGTGSLFGASKLAKGKSMGLEDVLNKRRSLKEGEIRIEPKMDVSTPPPEVKVAPKAATETQLEDAYDIFEGRKLLNKEGDPTSIAEMQIRNDVNKKAAEIASNIWSQVPELAPKDNQKISDAIKNVFMNIENIDDVVLKDSLANAGVTAEEFARMNRTTVGDAGRTLQSLSVLSRLQNRLKNIDPAAAKEVDLMYGRRSTIPDAFTDLYGFILRVDREFKALMVSQVSTTVRNAYSGLAVVTFGVAEEALESALYRMGKTVYELGSGKPLTGSFTGGLKGVYDDAVRTTFYLGQAKLSSDVAERLLAGSPTLRSRILRTAGETGDAELSKAAQLANTLNVAQDAFFRKAMFTASVEKQLSRVGINMYDVIEQGKNIPLDVLKNATDEALTGTFSKMPTKGPLFYAVKFFEAAGPLGSTAVPFPRFMANAIMWNLNHNIYGGIKGLGEIAVGTEKIFRGNEEGQRYLTKGLENISKSLVGGAAIYAAYKYRQENQDIPWYDVKKPDGSTVDFRPIFPAGPLLAMGDYFVKLEKGRMEEFKTKEFLEAMTGFKVPAGTSSWLMDNIAESWSASNTGESSAENKVSTFFGEWAGQYFGRALTPVKQVTDFVAAVDRNEALPRDAYQIPAGEEGFLSSFGSQIQKQIPIVKRKGIEDFPTIDQWQLSTRKIEGLPVYQPATRTEAAFSDTGPLRMFTGITVKAAPRPLEEEIIKLKIPNNQIFTSTGDKIVDANARKFMASIVVSTFDALKEAPDYKLESQDGKKIILENLLTWAETNAKKMAINSSVAAASIQNTEQLEEWEKKATEARSKGEVPPEKPMDIQARIFAIQYSKLPPELKRETAALYKKSTEKDLEETKDYTTALAIAESLKKKIKFAGGGLATQMAETLIGKGAAKVAKKSITESADDLLKKVTDMATKAGVAVEAAPTPAPAIKQTGELLKAPVVTPNKQAVSWDDLFNEPPATPKAPPITTPTPVKEVSFVDEINKYSPEQLNQAESLLKTSKGSQYQLDKYKTDFPDDYQKSFLIKLQEIAPEGKTTPPTPVDLSIASPDLVFTPINDLEKRALSRTPDLNKLPMARDDIYKRKEILQNIREIRQNTFPTLVDNLDELSFTKRIKPLDEEVVAVAQGEYRALKGREVEADDTASLTDFASFASKYQDKLDALRVKYKDTPPVILYHGNRTERTPEKLARGFYNPQTNNKSHFELKAGAISFTKDPNLNYYIEKFGGKDPKNISQVEIPYAEYEFRRVNMPLTAYADQDLNYLARSITGSPDVARPLSLPRSQIFKETEDAFVEADKLKITQDLAGVSEKYGKISARETKINDALTRLNDFNHSTNKKLGSFVDKRKTEEGKTIYTQKTPINASQAYKDIRTVFNEVAKSSEVTSTKTGYGQNYYSALEKYKPELLSSINSLLDVYKDKLSLEAFNSSPKPRMLLDLKKALSKTDQISNSAAEQKKGIETIRDITPKLNKGGGLGLRIDSTEVGIAPYGLRNSGEGVKGKGYFGALPNKEGGVSTEITSEFEYKGKNVEHPLIVPTLNKAELDHLLSGKKPTDAIYSKAEAFAKKRIDEGKSVFAEPTELHYPMPDKKGLASRK